jgi:hypothetical protein
MKRLPIAVFIAGLNLGLCAVAHADTQVLADPLLRGAIFPEVTADDALGTSVAGIGDFNGDGIDDFAIGAAPLRVGPSGVYLVFGRRDFKKVVNLAQDAERIHLAADADYRSFGIEVVAAGDVDRDGLADLWIYQEVDSHLYLLYGSKDLPTELTRDEIGTSYRGAVFEGTSLPTLTIRNPLAALKDFNGDAVPDLAIGKPDEIGPRNESGLVTVLFGSGAFTGALDLDAVAGAKGGVHIIGSVSSDNIEGLGMSLSDAGDVNGDGLSDLVVADPKFRNGAQQIIGRVHLVYGSRSFPALLEVDKLGSMGVTVENPDPLHGFGLVADVFGGGDLDGDGLAEFGFSQFDEVMKRILVIRGGKGLPPLIGVPQIQDGSLGFQIGNFLGEEVRLVPDEDGDGRPELLAGTQNGREALVLRGQYPMAAEAVERPLHRFQLAAGNRYADSRIISSAGDVNADGVPDYLFGASDLFAPAGDESRSNVFLVFGGFETRVLSVSAVSPGTAPLGQSVEVTISGTGFAQGVQVLFGDVAAPAVQFLDPHTLIASTPPVAAPGAADVTVVHPDSRRATLSAAFTFVEASRKVSLADLPGVVTFEPSHRFTVTSTVEPEVLGDVNGDGIEDYVLHAAYPGRQGAAHLVYGGKAWSGVVHDGPLNAGSVRFTFGGGLVPLVKPVGDLNGDGHADFAIWKFTQPIEFAVFFASPPEGNQLAVEDLQGDPRVAFFSNPDNDLDLSYLNRGADFDGDGEPDLVARVTKFSNSVRPPAIAILRGPFRPAEVVEVQYGGGRVIRIEDAQNPDWMGERVSFVGDLNGDGRPDLAYHDHIRSAFVVVFGHRPGSDLLEIAELERDGLAFRLPHQSRAFESAAFLSAGDLNGDGFGEILINALLTPADENIGTAGMIFGRREFSKGAQWNADLVPSGGFVLHGTVPFQFFGGDADLRGDLDGNGRPDLVLGASHLAQADGDPKGEVFVVHDVDDLRGDFKITDVPRVVTTIEGEAPFDRFGDTVRILGDQDGDRIPELLVEATYFRFGDPGPYRGKTFLIPGRSLFPPRPAGFRRGDVDANGRPEITDAVRLLGFLFLGEAGPLCQDAADADDTGHLDINDPVFILGYLFQGGLEPPAPGPTNCGSDPTADDLPECLPAC